jgi:hypothetical protein
VLKTTTKSRYTDSGQIQDRPWLNSIAISRSMVQDNVDAVCRTNHAEHETAEITHGFNDWFECGFYIFTFITEGQSWQTG